MASSLRIALMSPWNDCCGVAIHARLIGYAWLSLGHRLLVLASTDERPKGRVPLDTPDEPFVHRCGRADIDSLLQQDTVPVH